MNTIVKAENIIIDFPIYGTKSFKNTVITGITGGTIKMTEKNTTVRALNNISFEFYEGDRIGLWRHNGSGKTTLLRMLSGVYVPTAGILNVKGSIASLLNISLGNDDDASGIDNIYLRSALMGLSKKETEKVMEEIIEYTELGDFIHLPLRTYSSGMKMRLNFAISTALDADIILMDEWLFVGDADFAKKAQARLDKILEKSKLLVIASHDRKHLLNNCNRILNMEHGTITNEENLRI